MKIVVCIKQVKFIYAQTGTDPKQNFIGPDDFVRIINPLDESAVEEALRIKEKHKDAEVIVISLGDRFAEEGLRKCLSIGADKAIHLLVENGEKCVRYVARKLGPYPFSDLPRGLLGRQPSAIRA